MASLRATPRLRENLVWWKLGSTFLLCLAFCTAAILRTAILGTLPLGALLSGIAFLAATATSLGVMTGNAKTFIVLFLSFWYLVVNDHGANSWFDFAGFYRGGEPGTMAVYALASIGAVLLAQVFYRARLIRA
jgi:hypothetical protein